MYIDNTQLVYLRRCNNIQYTHFTLQWESVLTSQIVAYWTQWHWSEVCHPMINVIISNVSVVQSGFIGVQRRDVPCSSLASKLLLISLAWLWLHLQMTLIYSCLTRASYMSYCTRGNCLWHLHPLHIAGGCQWCVNLSCSRWRDDRMMNFQVLFPLFGQLDCALQTESSQPETVSYSVWYVQWWLWWLSVVININ